MTCLSWKASAGQNQGKQADYWSWNIQTGNYKGSSNAKKVLEQQRQKGGDC